MTCERSPGAFCQWCFEFPDTPKAKRATSDSCRKFRAYRQVCTDLNSVCYNSFTEQGQLLWVGVACRVVRFGLVSILSSGLRIWFYGLEQGDAGETVDSKKRQ